MTDYSIRQLSCAIIMQAVKDYCHKDATESSKRAILKDLRSYYMDTLTNGTSVIVAEQLELHPKEITERIYKDQYKEDYYDTN